jgi:hypothetical protein
VRDFQALPHSSPLHPCALGARTALQGVAAPYHTADCVGPPAAAMSRAPGKHKGPREPKEPKAARETYDVSRRSAGAQPQLIACGGLLRPLAPL